MFTLSNLLAGLNPETSLKTGPIGLDMGHERLNLVQLEQSASGLHIIAALSLPYPCDRKSLIAKPRQFTSFIKQAIKSAPFRGREVIACLPAGDEVKLINISYKKSADENDPEAIINELRKRMGPAINESIIDYIPIRHDDIEAAERSALVAIARSHDIIRHLDLLTNAGLDIKALDIGPAALTRLVASLDNNHSHPNVLLINFGKQSSYLTVIWGKRLILDREINFGEDRIIACLCQALGLDSNSAMNLLYDEGISGILEKMTTPLLSTLTELTNEINKTLIYTASKTHGGSIEHIYLVGSIARFPGIAEWMGDKLSIQVDTLNPFDFYPEKGDGTHTPDNHFTVNLSIATGLALRGIPHDV